MEQLKTIGRELTMGAAQGWGSSKEFMDLVKSIGEAKSKAEEERIVTAEIELLKRKIGEPDVPRKKMKEYILRLVYVEMLGHDASFGYIHAVKMTHDDNLLLKKSGYLAVTLFLNEDHDLIILIVNTIQKDLRSDNYLVVCAALTAVCRLINEETIPAVLPQVVELLSHPKELVKKKAVMALHRFYQRAPSTVAHVVSKFREVLCDKDPSVMGAALCALFDVITADVRSYKDMTTSFVSILKQVAEHRLPKLYDYYRTPAPFVQIKLLKILALLGNGDKRTSENMYSILGDVLKGSYPNQNIGNAILFECICTITSVHPHPKLLEDAADITSRFLKSESHNYKYMGIDALGRIIKINPEFAEQHQLAVIDCLEDPDDSLKRKTLGLLYKMTKSTNAEVIVERMISYMRTISDSHYKTEISSRIIDLAERFAPSNHWFIQTMNQVFELAGDLVPSKVAHDLMRLIAEGAGEDDDEDADSQLRSSAVESYLSVLGEPKLPSILLQVICWVLGEYGTTDGSHPAVEIVGKLCDVAQAHPGDDVVKGYAITAITKILAFEISSGRRVELLPECHSLVDELSASHSTDLQQRAYELQALLGLDRNVVSNVLPLDASCEDIEVDLSLSFLDDFVASALSKGARAYASEKERLGMSGFMSLVSHVEPAAHGLRFEAYEKPALPAPNVRGIPVVEVESQKLEPRSSRAFQPTPALPSSDMESSLPDGSRLRLDGVQKKWGRPARSSSTAVDRDSSNGSSTDGPNASGSRESKKSSSNEAHYGGKKTKEPVISAEKQKLAASIFGSAPKTENRRSSGGGETKSSRSAAQKGQQPTRSGNVVGKLQPAGVRDNAAGIDGQPTESTRPADLLDLSDGGVVTSILATVPAHNDPLKQLEGLLDVDMSASVKPTTTSKVDIDLMSLYGDALAGGNGISHFAANATSNSGDGFSGAISGLLDAAGPLITPSTDSLQAAPAPALKRGHSLISALQRDAASRQVGVTPTGQNPDLFKDLMS